MVGEVGVSAIVQNVLNRMKVAAGRGTGIRLSADEIQALKITAIGEMWEQPDPRTKEGIALAQEQRKRLREGN